MKTKVNRFSVKHLTVPTISKARFDQMLPATQRVKIAQDVLARQEVGMIKEKHGEYFQVLDPEIDHKLDVAENGTFSESDAQWREPTSSETAILTSDAKTLVNETKCEVCAKGACFLSFVAQFNNVDVETLKNFNGNLPEELKDIFPEQMWEAIEMAFEGNFGEHTKWSLKKVMQNIIVNKGNFLYDGHLYTDNGDFEVDKNGKKVKKDNYSTW